MDESRPRFIWMDTVRGLAIAFVVLHHAIEHVLSETSQSLGPLTVIDDAIDPFRMATLIFLSGMLLPRSLEKRPAVFVLGKLGRVGWPYLLWSMLVLSLLTIFGDASGARASTFASVFYAPPTYLWYLAYLLVFYLLALVIPVALRLAIIPLALLAGCFLGEHIEWQRFLFLMAFFFLGEAAARRPEVLDRLLKSRLVLASACLLAGATATTAAIGHHVRYQPVWALGAAAGVLVVIALCRLINSTRSGRWIAGYGRESLIFYVTHWAALRVSMEALQSAGVQNPWMLFVVSLVVGFAIPLTLIALQRRFAVVSYLFQLPLTKLVREQPQDGLRLAR